MRHICFTKSFYHEESKGIKKRFLFVCFVPSWFYLLPLRLEGHEEEEEEKKKKKFFLCVLCAFVVYLLPLRYQEHEEEEKEGFSLCLCAFVVYLYLWFIFSVR